MKISHQHQIRLFLLKGKLLLLLAGMNLFSSFSYSQTPGKDETLQFMNQLLGPKTQFVLKGVNLTVSFYDDNSNLVREDKVPTTDLDLAISYEADAGLLVIPCMKDQPECVTRTLVVQKIKRGYGRLSIPVSNEKDFTSLKKALDHLIRITSEDGYKDAVTLD